MECKIYNPFACTQKIECFCRWLIPTPSLLRIQYYSARDGHCLRYAWVLCCSLCNVYLQQRLSPTNIPKAMLYNIAASPPYGHGRGSLGCTVIVPRGLPEDRRGPAWRASPPPHWRPQAPAAWPPSRAAAAAKPKFTHYGVSMTYTPVHTCHNVQEQVETAFPLSFLLVLTH